MGGTKAAIWKFLLFFVACLSFQVIILLVRASSRNWVVLFYGGSFTVAVFNSLVRSGSVLARNGHLACCLFVTGSGRIVILLLCWRSDSYIVPQESRVPLIWLCEPLRNLIVVFDGVGVFCVVMPLISLIVIQSC